MSVHVQFGTKAETLARLQGQLKKAIVLPQFRFTVAQWLDAKRDINCLEGTPDWIYTNVIVRSSGQAEDSSKESLAGHFVSIANVKGTDALAKAITEVANSLSIEPSDDQIFIQPMLENVQVSGVAFSRDPSNSGHYYVLNYDDQSGETNTVTDGSTNALQTCYFAKHVRHELQGWQHDLLALLQELEMLLQTDAIDIEFAVNQQNELVLLQVRPLIIHETQALTAEQHQQALRLIQDKVESLSRPHPYLCGKRSVYGIMPDWNPAEIIGVRPRPLALSLYKELITDNIWAYQRHNYGYRNLRSFPLLISFQGLPYIDVRVSFNSFIPHDVEESLAEKLVNHYVNRLVENPTHHDKVEFEIIYSCYTLDLPKRLEKLLEFGFCRDDCQALEQSLRKLTNKIIHGQEGLWKKDIQKLDKLETRQNDILSSNLNPTEKIYWLIEDCKRYGTLPFAGLARAGFIAVQLLRSLVDTGILTESDYISFLNSLSTVSSGLSEDT